MINSKINDKYCNNCSTKKYDTISCGICLQNIIETNDINKIPKYFKQKRD